MPGLMEGQSRFCGKRIILIRHGNSTYNAWRSETIRTCRCLCARWEDHDAPLSAKGQEQVRALNEEIRARGLRKDVELIVASPLTRALDTARGGFWGVFTDDDSSTSASSREMDSIGSGCCRKPPIVALASVAERLDTACDIGTPASLLRSRYSDVDFQHVEEHWWYGGRDNCPEPGHPHDREPRAACLERVEETVEWLCRRPETCIAVVGHSAFFQALTGSLTKMPNCGIVELS